MSKKATRRDEDHLLATKVHTVLKLARAERSGNQTKQVEIWKQLVSLREREKYLNEVEKQALFTISKLS